MNEQGSEPADKAGPADPPLASLGKTQAANLALALQRGAAKGMPIPDRFFVSTLRRTGETCQVEWNWLKDNEEVAILDQSLSTGKQKELPDQQNVDDKVTVLEVNLLYPP